MFMEIAVLSRCNNGQIMCSFDKRLDGYAPAQLEFRKTRKRHRLNKFRSDYSFWHKKFSSKLIRLRLKF